MTNILDDKPTVTETKVVSTLKNNLFKIALEKSSNAKVAITPNIVVVGASGTGKSRSIVNLDPNRTAIINVERKILPFDKDFKFHITHPEESLDIEQIVYAALNEETIDIVVLDSFTKYCEYLMEFARKTQKGYDIYNVFNQRVFNFLEKIKLNNNKIFIMIAIDELVDLMQPSGLKQHLRRVAIPGKVWEGKIEKEFSIVLYTDVVGTQGTDKRDYKFVTNSDGTNSAKSPEGLFDFRIPNDLKFVVNKLIAKFSLNIKPIN